MASKHTLSQQAIEEEWVLIQIAQKNPSRFGVLYNKYYEPIFRYIYQRTADEELCADLTSQVFLKAMQNLSKYTYKGVPFSAWLYRIAANELNQFYRQNQKTRTVSIEDKFVENIKIDYEEQEKETIELDLNTLKSVLQLIKPDELLLVELRFFEKRPYKEIALILEMTETNAKVKVYRLLIKLKKLFDDHLGKT